MNSSKKAEPLSGDVLGHADGTFLIAEWTDEGGGFNPPMTIAPLHSHRTEDEAWYVLEGILCVQSGSEIWEVAAGCGVLVPAGTPHTYWNPSTEPARYLLTMGSRTRALIEAIHAKQRTWPELKELFAEYDADLLG